MAYFLRGGGDGAWNEWVRERLEEMRGRKEVKLDLKRR